MIKAIIITAIVAIAAVLIYVAARPNAFTVERKVSIKAAPEKIYPYMSDFHRGQLWNPYDKRDPAMKRTFSGPESGIGAVYDFDGNKDIGKGRLEVIEAVPPAKVILTLDMIKPFKAHNIVEYTLERKDDGTEVTWATHGRNTYLGKVLCVFVNMDKMIGKDFETGLANLKDIIEKG